MSELSTLRKRVERASQYFREMDGVVLTTFNMNGDFLEDHALPAVLGVEAKTSAGRRAELHQRLGTTPCTVFYDPATRPRVSGRYRYVARPVPMRGRFFHPKLVVIAGRSENRTTWVYLAVSSANLTLSGWGRNAESFGETWIHTRLQQPWTVLDKLLDWLGSHSSLGEKQSTTNAVARVRAALARMPERRRFSNDDSEPWSGTLRAKLYVSVVHKEGLAAFLRGERAQGPSALWAYSPYWSDVAEQVAEFDARETVLVPALRADGGALGLSREQAAELADKIKICRNERDVGDRFWHMKAYWTRNGERVRTAVGSSNFTRAGLSGGDGNVEAMLELDGEPEWLPEGAEVDDNLAEEEEAEEGVPEPAPVSIVVAWDWRASVWRWWLEEYPRHCDFKLCVPALAPFPIRPGTGSIQGKPPERGAMYKVSYHADGKKAEWQGQIVELNLDNSSRTYGRSLTANEILESWRGKAPTWDLGGGGGDGDPGDDRDDLASDTPAAFDAVNLFDFYRSMSTLRRKLKALEEDQQIQHGYLVGRPDSVMALAKLADRDEEAPIVRFLVLRELHSVASTWASVLDEALLERIGRMTRTARDRTHVRLRQELDGDEKKAGRMLNWFEVELAGLDGGMDA